MVVDEQIIFVLLMDTLVLSIGLIIGNSIMITSLKIKSGVMLLVKINTRVFVISIYGICKGYKWTEF